MKTFIDNDRIFALATPLGKSALAVIRLCGPDTIKSFSPCFSAKKTLLTAESNTLVHGLIADVDEVVVAVYREGHGYTGQESLEIFCHGSLASISLLTEKLVQLGFRQAERGEFTLRAFLNGRLDLTQAEAVNEIASSRTSRSQKQALDKLGGSLKQRIQINRTKLLEVMSTVEVQLDYAEDEIGGDTTFPMGKLQEVRDDLQKLSSTWETGRLLGQGAKVVLAGAANAGKSSLFNLLLKQERSIVSAQPGTTRDFIESDCEIAGIPVRLFDTAGLRDSDEMIEAEGIRRTHQLMDDSDLLLYLVDSASPEDGYEDLTDQLRIRLPNVRKILIWNKTDLHSTIKKPDGFVQLSVNTTEGFEALVKLISATLESDGGLSKEDVIIESPRQHQCLEDALKAIDEAASLINGNVSLDIVAMELKEALDQIGYICGELTTDEMLDKIFSDFCVGK